MVEVIIAGAGPYGLSIAAHLRERQVPFRIIGEPMKFWREMPDRLFLKSLGFATNVTNPQGLGYAGWCREHGLEDREPCSIESFAEYGLQVQKQLVPEVEPTEVAGLERTGQGFLVTLARGERFEARRAVIAVGLRYFRRMPRELAQLPPALASHTSDNKSYASFKGKDVCVVGAGQSALEAAALLHENGARPQLLVRGPRVIFHHGATPKKRSLLARLRAPLSTLGEGKVNWTLENLPLLAHFLPDSVRVRFTRRHLGPSGSWWVRERCEGKLPFRLNCEVVSAEASGSGVLLRVRESGEMREIHADHVVAGTGYEVDVDRLPFLSEDLRRSIARIERAPRLDRHFQSSVPGLYFVGALSAFSFGPLFRFVAGTAYAGPAMGRHLARTMRWEGAPELAVSPE